MALTVEWRFNLRVVCRVGKALEKTVLIEEGKQGWLHNLKWWFPDEKIKQGDKEYLASVGESLHSL